MSGSKTRAAFACVAAAALLAYPWVFTGAFYERMGADLLLAAIAASAWNIVEIGRAHV